MRKLAPLVLLVALAACGPKETGDTQSVSMADHAFTPETVTITAGDSVEWVNDTDEAHTVTAVEASIPPGTEYFSSGDAVSEDEALETLSDELLDPGVTFSRSFSHPGTYRYYCIPHRADGMEGTIVVEE